MGAGDTSARATHSRYTPYASMLHSYTTMLYPAAMMHGTPGGRRVPHTAIRLVALVGAILLGSCQSAPPPQDYEPLATAAAEGKDVSVEALRRAFLASPDFTERMQELAPLERQAMQLMDDEPLRLGAVGSAILDVYYGSIAGHYSLLKFYEHVEEEDGVAEHQAWVSRINTAIRHDADGSRTAPYHVVSAFEAQAFLKVNGMTPVGSMYHSTDAIPFMMLVTAQPQEGRLENVYFDLTDAYEAVRATVERGDSEQPFSPGVLIGYLAQRDDSAAQTSIGAYLFARKDYPNAIDWLTAATRTGNVLANLLLARVYQTQAEQEDGAPRKQDMEFALEQYLHAIAMQSDEAMFQLGALYLEGSYGETNIDSGVTLLKQAATLGNTDAMVWLAHLYGLGTHVEENLDTAADYYRQAGEAGDVRARLQYARFLLLHAEQRPFDPEAVKWLRNTADEDHPEAMLLLGNLYAKGIGVSRSYRRSLGWFKEAVSNAPDDANIVNEVAWTLAVTNLEDLRDPRYALKIMERVMTSDEVARKNPAYLDTWAAAYAANGQFERAIDLQTQAVSEAEALKQTDVVDVLREHLDAFHKGQTIVDPVP